MHPASPESGPSKWRRFRELMPVAKNYAYFDHAAVSPLPAPTRQAISQWLDQATEQGDAVWADWSRRVEEIRRRAASMIAALPEEIAFVPNTTSGVSLVAEGFPWRQGDNIVTLANEFPSNVFPWMNLAQRGVETRLAPVGQQGRVDWKKIDQLCDDRTRIIALSWVGYASGWRIDVAEAAHFAHQRGALLFLDAIQGLGVFPLDVRDTGVDFVAADGHKWMLGPEGAGLFFIRQEHLSLLRPLMVGWNSVPPRQGFDQLELTLRDEAARYEGGSQNMAGIIGLGASLDLLAEMGVGPANWELANQVLELTALARDKLSAAGANIASPIDCNNPPANASGILSFTLGDEPPLQQRRRLLGRKTVVSCRGGKLRIALHGYNNQADLDRLLEELKEK